MRRIAPLLVLSLPLVAMAACARHAPGAADHAAQSPTTGNNGGGPSLNAAIPGGPEAPASLEAPTKWPELAVKTDGAYVYSKSRYVYIYADPSNHGKWIGYLYVGDAVKLKSNEAVAGKKGSGCSGSWYSVEPKGYVCVDGQHATIDAKDPVYSEVLKHAPDLTSPWPYIYGESKGETRLKQLDGVEQPAWPDGLQDMKQAMLPPRSTVAWTQDVQTRAGLPYLWLSDLTFLHKDSVKPYPRIEFHGIHLGGDIQLPLAFFRRVPRPKLKRDGDNFTETGESWARLSWVKLTGKSEKNAKATYWETSENGLWFEEHDAGIVKPLHDSTPWKAPIKLVSSGTIKKGAADRRTWVEVAALHGWMIAYEDDEPVFATMISGGKLGASTPRATEPHQPPATTPIGHFKIDAKFVTTTLKAELNDGTDFIHSEVPWSQHFYSKFLLHTAYWHDNWGEGRSGGCVNMSPIDAKWLFDWTQPELPAGWHAYKTWAGNHPSGKGPGKGDDEVATVVLVHL